MDMCEHTIIPALDAKVRCRGREVVRHSPKRINERANETHRTDSS
jgi:hypothetical protein